MTNLHLDGTLTSRYELKYLITPSLAGKVRLYLAPFMQPDKFTAGASDGSYSIKSLYLDTPALHCYFANRQGHPNRFKLRIRTYSDADNEPAFFEVKKRSNRLVRKSRAKVAREVAPDLLSGRPFLTRRAPGGEQDDFQEFVLLSQKTSVQPTLWVGFRREAYEAIDGDPARITFDTDVDHALPACSTLCTSNLAWHPTPIDGKTDQVIMEVKFTDISPSWLQNMIHAFDLQNRSISKYTNSVAHVRQTGTAIPALLAWS